MDKPSRIIAVETLPLNYEALKPHLDEGCHLHLEVGPSGGRLRQPILIPIKGGTSLRELDIINYIISSLSDRRSALIPWVLGSQAMVRLAAHLRRHRTSSPGTLTVYSIRLKLFCDWAGVSPDGLIEAAGEAEGLKRMSILVEDYIGELQARGLTPKSMNVAASAIRTLLRVNGVEIPKPILPKQRIIYEDRAPRPEELVRLLEAGDLREKTIISILALSGLRLGTLSQLKYRHVREELEAGRVPLHIHVPSEITKGKYGSYDTFIGSEAIDYLKLYLEQRRRGTEKIPPEPLTDESPLIRDIRYREPKHLDSQNLARIVRNLYIKAGLIRREKGRRCILRPHSLRKYFRTQLAALGVPSDYIEYMMGHRISTYHDIQMKGVEFLRNIYAASGLSIKPRTQLSRIDMLKEIIRAWGMDPERILIKEALLEPHRTIIDAASREDEQTKILATHLKELLRRELLDAERT